MKLTQQYGCDQFLHHIAALYQQCRIINLLKQYRAMSMFPAIWNTKSNGAYECSWTNQIKFEEKKITTPNLYWLNFQLNSRYAIFIITPYTKQYQKNLSLNKKSLLKKYWQSVNGRVENILNVYPLQYQSENVISNQMRSGMKIFVFHPLPVHIYDYEEKNTNAASGVYHNIYLTYHQLRLCVNQVSLGC